MKQEKDVIVIKIEEDVKTWEKFLGFGVGIIEISKDDFDILNHKLK
jgi:hypothetical protein